MIDIFIVAFSFVGTIAYALIQVIFVRYVDDHHRLMFSFWLQMFISFLLVLSLIAMRMLDVMTPQTVVIVAVASQAIFHGVVTLYLFTVFRVFNESLTIRLLAYIANAGRDGRSAAEISCAFRPRAIVKQHLDRCVSMRLLRRDGVVYIKPFAMRGCVLFLWIDRCVKMFFSPIEK